MSWFRQDLSPPGISILNYSQNEVSETHFSVCYSTSQNIFHLLRNPPPPRFCYINNNKGGAKVTELIQCFPSSNHFSHSTQNQVLTFNFSANLSLYYSPRMRPNFTLKIWPVNLEAVSLTLSF